MNILIVNSADLGSGSARAAYRLHRALLESGIESRMLVQRKNGDDYTVIGPDTKFHKVKGVLLPAADQIPLKFYPERSQTYFSPAWVHNGRIIEYINSQNPDIVHLHWINGGMLKIEDLKQIAKPLVWSLHDMWAFTGGCHYDEGCGRYMNTCGQCPVLGSGKERDLSRWVYGRKKKTYAAIDNLTMIGLSRWLTSCSVESPLLKKYPHINLPNPIDTERFKPFEKKAARQLWNLPQDKKLILFGATKATEDPRKGFLPLSEALTKLEREDVELVVFGSGEPEKTSSFGHKAHYVGHLHDDISLMTLYNACDVMVVPSLQENLSNAIMESLSCAVPVVAFDIGGNADMIVHRVNGYLAQAFDSADLARGIEWVLNHNEYDTLCQSAREKVLREFDSSVVAKKYIELYQSILESQNE